MSLLADRDPDGGPDTRGVRVATLGEADREDLMRLIDADPLVNVVADVRMRQTRSLEPGSVGTGLLGARDDVGRLRAALIHGGSMQPIGGGPEEWTAFARHLADHRRGCSSIVGRADAVGHIWGRLRPTWGAERALRAAQPLLWRDRSRPLAPGDPRVRRMAMPDLDRYVPAAAAMFTEELGIDPARPGLADEYRRRVAGLIAAGRAFGIVDERGSVVFKADLGAVSPRTCQVQGVWVRPDLRGRGIAAPALASVLQQALDLAPTVSLYVNDFNVPARRVYDRLGMVEAAVVSTVLF